MDNYSNVKDIGLSTKKC